MTDNRLQSVHLPSPRREAFRSAREGLLSAQGTVTRVLDCSGLDSEELVAVPAPPRLRPRHMLLWDAKEYPLRPGINTLGRNHANDIIVRHPQVSRRHCSILVHSDGRCEVHNLASLNGTWLNEARLSGPETLIDGDQLRLGPVCFRFHTDRGVEATMGSI